jgi:hypothetical protein
LPFLLLLTTSCFFPSALVGAAGPLAVSLLSPLTEREAISGTTPVVSLLLATLAPSAAASDISRDNCDPLPLLLLPPAAPSVVVASSDFLILFPNA